MREMHPEFCKTDTVEVAACTNWNNHAGLTRRMLDVINQCKYLAAKKGMNLQELRRALREDEAKQRQLLRQQQLQQQQKLGNNYCRRAGGGRSSSGTAHYSSRRGYHDRSPMSYPIWNSDGTIYSHQYNLESYGMNYESSSSSSSSSSCSNSKIMESDTVSRHPPKIFQTNPNDENLVNLLYSANSNSGSGSGSSLAAAQPSGNLVRRIPIPTLSDKQQSPRAPPSRIGGSSGIVHSAAAAASGIMQRGTPTPTLYRNPPPALASQTLVNCPSTDSFVDSEVSVIEVDLSRINRPVRKMASHDLTTLMPSMNPKRNHLGQSGHEGRGRKAMNIHNKDEDDFSFIMAGSAEDFSTSDEDEDNDEDKTENLNEDYASDFIEELECSPRPQEDRFQQRDVVKSPLLKKVESAFADIQKNDSLFGDRNDFGCLMERIL